MNIKEIKSTDTIHICFGVHDVTGKYCKYTAVTMVSILQNTKSNVIFHILHDDTLTDENRAWLNESVRPFSSKIIYHRVIIDEKRYEEYNMARFTIGALYRLKICEVLSNVSRVIYLDSDIVVNLDIKELWDEDLGCNLIAGCVIETVVKWPLIEKGIIDVNNYINSGVLIMNLDAISQKHNLWGECNEFIIHKTDLWRGPDQDAINYVFRNEIKKLDDKYNSRVTICRKNNISGKRIYHFIGDSPRDLLYYEPDILFYDALKKTPWGSEEKIIEHYEKRIEEKDNQKYSVYLLMKEIYENPKKKKVFWGIGGGIHSYIMDMIPWNEGDYFVDSKELFWYKAHMLGMVYPPTRLENEDPKKTIVIVTIFRYNEVKPVLEKYGFIENSNFFNGKYLLSEMATAFCDGERDNKWDL